MLVAIAIIGLLITDAVGMDINHLVWGTLFWSGVLAVFLLGWSLGAYFFSLKSFYLLGEFVREFEGKEFFIQSPGYESVESSSYVFARKMGNNLHFFYVNFPKNEKTDWAKEALTGKPDQRIFFVKGGKIYPKK